MCNISGWVSFKQYNESFMKRNFTFFATCMAFLLLSFASCNNFDGEQKVPAYLRIDSVGLKTDPNVFGVNTHNITDVWVYVDDKTIGTFEIPATFPVLKEGKHKLSIYGGIKLNGISESRIPYPFFKPLIIEDFGLYPDSVVSLAVPQFEYYELNTTTHVAWIEDFEVASVTLEPGAFNDSTVLMERVSQEEGAMQWEHSYYSGKITLPADTNKYFFFQSYKSFDELPTNGAACMLELDFNTNDTVVVGVISYKHNKATLHDLVKLMPTDPDHDTPNKWKKIYVNIGPIVIDNKDADKYKIYIQSVQRDPRISKYYFDNFKLLYRER